MFSSFNEPKSRGTKNMFLNLCKMSCKMVRVFMKLLGSAVLGRRCTFDTFGS